MIDHVAQDGTILAGYHGEPQHVLTVITNRFGEEV